MSISNTIAYTESLLFGIIGCIGEEPWIESSQDTIWTSCYKAMLICLHKFVVEDQFPDRVHKLSFQMGQGCSRHVCVEMFLVVIENRIGKLGEYITRKSE